MALLDLEQIESEHRDKRQRQNQRRTERQHDGQGDRREKLAFQPLQRQQRQEYQRDDCKARSDRLGHFDSGDEHVVDFAVCRVFGIGKPLYNILDHDHRAIDEDADGDRKPAQAHEIGAEANRSHEDEGQQDGHRQCQCDDHRGSDIAEK